MTTLRLSSAHWVRAFGLTPSAGRGFYDSETTNERGYPLFSCFLIIVLMLLSWQGHVHFHAAAFLCVSMSGGVLLQCWIGTSFTCNLGYNVVYNLLYPIMYIISCSFIYNGCRYLARMVPSSRSVSHYICHQSGPGGLRLMLRAKVLEIS